MKSSAKRPLLADKHFANMHRWLEMEGEAERERLAQRLKNQSSDTAERSGETLLDLVIRTHTTGLGGRYLITLAKTIETVRMTIIFLLK